VAVSIEITVEDGTTITRSVRSDKWAILVTQLGDQGILDYTSRVLDDKGPNT
jgi:hypothetical protein